MPRCLKCAQVVDRDGASVQPVRGSRGGVCVRAEPTTTRLFPVSLRRTLMTWNEGARRPSDASGAGGTRGQPLRRLPEPR